MNTEYKSNFAHIVGVVKSLPKYSHTCYNEEFYKLEVYVCRSSGVYDIVDVIVSQKLYPMKNISVEDVLSISGEYRSKNLWENGKNRLILMLFSKEIELIIEKNPMHENSILIDGFVCKDVIYRKTPLSREIADIMLAVNRRNGKSDYIPCIAWGRNAVFASSLNVGAKVHIEGRIQSRRYTKQTDNGLSERVANEVSVSFIDYVD